MRINTVLFALSSTFALVSSAFPAQKPFVSDVTIANEHSVIESGFGGTEKVRFDGHKVIEIEVNTSEELEKVTGLVETYNLDPWTPLRIGSVQLRIPPSLLTLVLPDLPGYRTVHEDVQSLIDSVPISSLTSEDDPDDPESFFRSYHTYDEVTNFTFALASKYPSIAQTFSAGKTYEGRDIWGLRLFGGLANMEADYEYEDDIESEEDEMIQRLKKGFEGMLENDGLLKDLTDEGRDILDWTLEKLGLDKFKSSKEPKTKAHAYARGIVLHGGQHAREWISVAVLCYIMDAFASSYGTDQRITHLIDTFEWSLIPVMNVDGYIFTHEKNRMWRKNRQPTPFPWCTGIDTNRNWGYKWNHGGSSSNPCSESYMGQYAFSSHESKAMADFIASKSNLIAYIDFHAFSQLWMTPFGADCEEKPNDNEDILELGMGAAKAIARVHGKKFEVGPVCEIIYQASGSSQDWTYAVARVKYSYGVELRDTGVHGFILPPEEILPSGREILSAVVYMAQFIEDRDTRP